MLDDKYYRRAFVDEDLQIFCVTYIPLGIPGYTTLVGTDEDFGLLRKTLKSEGFIETQRLGFKSAVSKDVVVPEGKDPNKHGFKPLNVLLRLASSD